MPRTGWGSFQHKNFIFEKKKSFPPKSVNDHLKIIPDKNAFTKYSKYVNTSMKIFGSSKDNMSMIKQPLSEISESTVIFCFSEIRKTPR